MQKICLQCSAKYEVTSDDLAFYAKVSPEFNGKKYLIPPPTLCPECRMQRRLSFRNERSLHHRKCSKTDKSIISMYPSTVPFPVFENEEWWKDEWSGIDYGRDFDTNRTMFDQYADLLRVVPRMARVQQGENPNSQYTNCASNNKNCYLLFSSNGNEDCLYGGWVNSSRQCVDCQQILRSELCYECVDCGDCYACAFVRDSYQCSDSRFLVSCIGCKNCFGCVGLRQKEYCIFNEQQTKEEYQRKMGELPFHSHAGLAAVFEAFHQITLHSPVRSYEGTQNEHVSGNHITQSKNAIECYDSNGLEDCKWCTNAQFFTDSCDVSYYGSSGSNELIYECEGVGHSVRQVLFSKLVWGGSSDLLYCYECFACQDCIACIGLRHQQYCILNKQYSKEQYELLAASIINRMQQAGEWGEFFSVALSPFRYNETVAHDYFPLGKEEVLQKGWQWHEEDGQEQYLGPDYAIPDSIQDVPDDSVNVILRCSVTDKPYKIIPQELAFYRLMGIPLPRKCPDQRHTERMALRNPRKLWARSCAKCSKSIQTTYAPERPEIVYCEECYLQTVY